MKPESGSSVNWTKVAIIGIILVGAAGALLLGVASGIIEGPPPPILGLVRSAVCDRLAIEGKTYMFCDDGTMWTANPLTAPPSALPE